MLRGGGARDEGPGYNTAEKAGKTSDAVASALDFLPTICEMTGARITNPKDQEGLSHSISL